MGSLIPRPQNINPCAQLLSRGVLPPVWHHSAHTKLVDTALNSAMRLVTGCIRPTPTSQLSILSGIAPPDLRREAQYLNLLARAEATPNHLMHYITEKNMCSQPRLRRQTLSNRLCALRVEAQTASPNAWPCKGGPIDGKEKTSSRGRQRTLQDPTYLVRRWCSSTGYDPGTAVSASSYSE